MTLVCLASLTDAAHASTLSFYLLLCAVPAIVVAGLASLEELVEGAPPHRRMVAMLHVVTLLLVLIAAALRAPLRAEGTVPPAAVSAVIACLVVFAAQALFGYLPAIRRVVPTRPRVGGVAALGPQPPVVPFLGDDVLAEPGERSSNAA
jgi:uncharacterized membrane protein